ncbi:outer membrane beta-barrel protein [Manganibacter manganicus]|uniref:Outer membrane beta-barrel protein n=1 Tax=Manganibacter manganicus TaxID=1873176 RepID=A0A1V8RV58_9HYPH|nr:outer membrane beta-barrel protein [Pseudaminobacter manganicus]OQM77086.1 hypothetical protein BFN67_11410 [Pseudaminobacter manganicus]
MPRSRPETRRYRRSEAISALLLAGSLCALTTVVPAMAQDLELRGEVSESAIQNDQQAKTRRLAEAQAALAAADAGNSGPTGLSSAPYQPASPDPFADDDSTGSISGSIFDERSGNAAGAPAVTNRRSKSGSREKIMGQDRQGIDQPEQKKSKPTSIDSHADGVARLDKDTETTALNPRALTANAQEREPLDRGAERVEAIEGHDAKPEDDPFAPVGIRLGSFVLRPAIEQGITATSNADSAPDGQSATLSETTLRLNAASDWTRHSAMVNGYGTFRKSLSGEELHDATGRIEGQLDLDLGNEWRAIGKLGYETAPESASSPVVIQGTLSQPQRQTFDGSLGIEKHLGKLRFGLTGAAEHDSYGDADLSSGGTISQKDRDSTLYTATLRGGYEISPALMPFVEAELGHRAYNQRIDQSGFERSSNRIGLRTGLKLDFGEKLGGEFSAGWIRETFDDDRLGSISAPTLAAELKWSPERGTVVGLRGTTTLEDTTTAGESGSVLYSSRLTAERQIRANLTAEAALGLDWRDYSGTNGHDLIWSAEAGLTWWMNRYAGIRTRLRHESVTSNLPGRDSHTNSVYLGLILQR